MSRALIAALQMHYHVTTMDTPTVFHATSMNPESVTLDHYDQMEYDKCTSEELLWAYGSEDYLSQRSLSTKSTETGMSCASIITMLRDNSAA